jgi:hypothetical protein
MMNKVTICGVKVFGSHQVLLRHLFDGRFSALIDDNQATL